MLRHLTAWIAVFAAMLGISGGLYVYKRDELSKANAAASAQPEPTEAVSAVRARRGAWTTSTRAIGTVVALRRLEIRNERAGTISRLGFQSGAIVESGQVLVEFDTAQEEAAFAAAQAEADLAKLTLERRESLKGSAAFSPQEFDKARQEHAAAKARARNLEVAIEKKRIHAPFKARVGIIDLQPGAYLDVGTLIARLQGVDADAYVDFSLSQDGRALIRPGVEVSMSGPGLPQGSAAATIMAEDDSVDTANRMVRFRAVARGLGETLRPGAFVDIVAITSQPRESVFVPLSALRRSTSGQHVFVIVDADGKKRAKQRAVETGPVQDNDIAIEKGLSEGELVAASGSFKLRDGVAVQAEAVDPAPASAGVN
ncbi:MAG: efflux RND transporter periplasmic adaptor subunit [Hyphomicrobium sp.]